MQAYNESFAKIYRMRWENFARAAAPKAREYYESTPLGARNRTLLDLCCGTGQLAMHFLENGYQVTGLDLSPAMLDYARPLAAAHIVAGLARFVEGDAASFSFPDRFGLIVSTFDALNHLPNFAALRGCFHSAYAALEPGGTFLFDLNTPEGLRRWRGINIEDSPELMLITRAFFDAENQRAFMHISGFVAARDGLYERFEETTYETAFDLAPVREALIESGFRSVRFASLKDLSAPVDDPDSEMRIFIIAEK